MEPYLVIRVSEAPSAVGASLGYEPYSVGEALVSLEDRRPCCALDVDVDGDGLIFPS